MLPFGHVIDVSRDTLAPSQNRQYDPIPSHLLRMQLGREPAQFALPMCASRNTGSLHNLVFGVS